MTNLQITHKEKKINNTPGVAVNENKYKGRELPLYFDISLMDAFIPEEFFTLVPNPMPQTEELSLINVYKLLIDGRSLEYIPFVERSRILKRTYNVMLRFITFYKFCYIIEMLLGIRLCSKVLDKVKKSLCEFNIRCENLVHPQSSFPTQTQTLARIDKMSKTVISDITIYANDIVTFLKNRKINGIDLLNIRKHCLAIFLKGYQPQTNNIRWGDADYFAYILTNQDALEEQLDSVNYNQLLTYIDDFYTQMVLIYLSFKLVENCATKDLQDYLTFLSIRSIVKTSCISMNPSVFTANKKLSLTEFKNILLMLENVTRALSIELVKNRFVGLTIATDALLEHRATLAQNIIKE